MYMTPAQAANFVPYLGRALAAAHLPTRVACCDAEGWTDGESYTQAVPGNPASARYVSLITSHGYTAPPTVPLTSERPVRESEWADFSAWDPAWDDSTNGDGFTWAQDIQTALTQANVNAFFYWWGVSASTANSGLIQVQGATINLSKRYWSFAAFGRYIRPGALAPHGGHHLGAGSWPAAVRDEAAVEAPGLDEAEAQRRGQLAGQRLPAAGRRRLDDQAVLIDQALGREGRGEARGATRRIRSSGCRSSAPRTGAPSAASSPPSPHPSCGPSGGRRPCRAGPGN
jgi:hypothetical protein